MATHRLTVQFEARLSFNLNLPHDDSALVREQTPLRVVVERVRGANDSADGNVRGRLDGNDSLSGSFSSGLQGSVSPGAVAAITSGCASYALIIRVGVDGEARDYPQAEFVHRSAAEGAAQCLLQYLAAKPKLNVTPTLVTDRHPAARDHEHHTYTVVGWSMSKADALHPDGTPTICGKRHSLHHEA
jgi:hypothetical protein